MDNYTLIQTAARRRPEGERAGFSSLSRADQADRWAAWQASSDAVREATPDTYPAYEPQPRRARAYCREAAEPDMFIETEYARRAAQPEPEVTAQPAAAQPAAIPPEPQPRRSFALYNEIVARHDQVFGRGR